MDMDAALTWRSPTTGEPVWLDGLASFAARFGLPVGAVRQAAAADSLRSMMPAAPAAASLDRREADMFRGRAEIERRQAEQTRQAIDRFNRTRCGACGGAKRWPGEICACAHSIRRGAGGRLSGREALAALPPRPDG